MTSNDNVERGHAERVSLAPLTPEDALRALLWVNPGSEPAEPEDDHKRQDEADARNP